MTNRVDNFNRTDNALTLGTPSDGGSDWVPQSGTWGISSFRAYKVATDSAQECVTLEASVADVEVLVTWFNSGGGGLIGRLADDSNHLLLQWLGDNSSVILYKKVSGSYTSLASSGVAGSSGDALKLRMDSSNLLSAYTAGSGTPVFSVTDSAGSTNTKHGLQAYHASVALGVSFDDFSITAIGGGTTLKLFTPSSLNGLGAGGAFFHDRLA